MYASDNVIMGWTGEGRLDVALLGFFVYIFHFRKCTFYLQAWGKLEKKYSYVYDSTIFIQTNPPSPPNPAQPFLLNFTHQFSKTRPRFCIKRPAIA